MSKDKAKIIQCPNSGCRLTFANRMAKKRHRVNRGYMGQGLFGPLTFYALDGNMLSYFAPNLYQCKKRYIFNIFKWSGLNFLLLLSLGRSWNGCLFFEGNFSPKKLFAPFYLRSHHFCSVPLGTIWFLHIAQPYLCVIAPQWVSTYMHFMSVEELISTWPQIAPWKRGYLGRNSKKNRTTWEVQGRLKILRNGFSLPHLPSS